MEFEGIPFEVVRRRVKYSRVEFRASSLRVIVPRGIDPLRVLEDNKKSILKKYHKLMVQVETARNKSLTKRSNQEFETLVTRCLEHYSRQLKALAQKDDRYTRFLLWGHTGYGLHGDPHRLAFGPRKSHRILSE